MLSDIVGNRVRCIRESRGWTREQLAAECRKHGAQPDLSATALGYIETGRRDPQGNRRRAVTVDEAAALARAFRTDISTLISSASCECCAGAPPEGFACRSCGQEG